MANDYCNTIVLFKNEKRTAENQPVMQGNMTDESGRLWAVALWPETSAKGNKFWAGKITVPRPKDGNGQKQNAPVSQDDDMPF